MNVKMNAASIGGTISLAYTGSVVVPSDGIVTVDVRDAAHLLAIGATYLNTVMRYFGFPVAPAAASTARLVASAALSNGSKAVANQPDVPRQGVLRIDPGTSAITAGTVSIPYIAPDGTSVTDVVSLVAPASTVVSTITSKGILVLSPIVVAGLVGGASPKIQMNDTNSLSPVVDPGFVDFSIVQTLVDGVSEGQSAVVAGGASYTPSTTPNGTHTYGVYFDFSTPNT